MRKRCSAHWETCWPREAWSRPRRWRQLRSAPASTAPPAQTARGVVGERRVHFHFPEPQTYPRESGEKPGEKSPPVSRTGKGRQPNQDTERRAWEAENGQFSPISAVCGVWEPGSWPQPGEKAGFGVTPASSFPLLTVPAHHLAVLPHSTRLPPQRPRKSVSPQSPKPLVFWSTKCPPLTESPHSLADHSRASVTWPRPLLRIHVAGAH